jgi:hypothetical protein
VRALQEHAVLLKELVHLPVFNEAEVAEYSERADVAVKRAQMLREALALNEEDEGSSARSKK